MAAAIIGGLIQNGYCASNIIASDPNQAQLEQLHEKFAITTEADNLKAVAKADVVLLAVKPQVLGSVAKALAPALTHQPLIISIAAGIPIASLAAWLGDSQALVRCMPNTPALVGVGASGLYANAYTNPAQRALAEQILAAVGVVAWLDEESQIDAVTAVSGSGPAYFFYVMEAMIEEGVRQGLSADLARQLTIETALGAATLAKASDEAPAELRRRVTSPGGTTEQAIRRFDEAGLPAIFAEAMVACAERSVTLAEELGNTDQ